MEYTGTNNVKLGVVRLMFAMFSKDSLMATLITKSQI